jgi:hypothetical protein
MKNVLVTMLVLLWTAAVAQAQATFPALRAQALTAYQNKQYQE